MDINGGGGEDINSLVYERMLTTRWTLLDVNWVRIWLGRGQGLLEVVPK